MSLGVFNFCSSVLHIDKFYNFNHFKHMGLFSSKSIRVATANYSGITNSPFQFCSEDSSELRQLNEIFIKLFSQLPLISNQDQKINPVAILKKYTNYDKLEDEFGGGKRLARIKQKDDREGSQPSGMQQASVIFDWKISNIEKSIQKGRYCAQYREDAGVQNCCFLQRHGFFKKWETEFNKNIRYVKLNEKSSESMARQKEVCRIFDFLVFKTFVQYSYMQAQTEPTETTIKDRDTDGSKASRLRRKKALNYYEQFMERYHKMPYLKHQLKFNYIKKLIETHDVVFLQDCCEQLINEIKNEGDYTIIEQIEGRDCFIIVKTSLKRFRYIYDANKYIKDQKQEDNLFHLSKFNYGVITSGKRFSQLQPDSKQSQDDCFPSICFIDNFLFLSIHLSSRKERKYNQLLEFMAHMVSIHQTYNGQLKIVIGGDFNTNIKRCLSQSEFKQAVNLKKVHYAQNQYELIEYNFWQNFECYPTNKEEEQKDIITTKKKRTWLQSQVGKAEKQDAKSRDFLISNFSLQNCKIINMGARLSKHDYLPTGRHPFDHFFISAEIGATLESRSNRS